MDCDWDLIANKNMGIFDIEDTINARRHNDQGCTNSLMDHRITFTLPFLHRVIETKILQTTPNSCYIISSNLSTVNSPFNASSKNSSQIDTKHLASCQTMHPTDLLGKISNVFPVYPSLPRHLLPQRLLLYRLASIALFFDVMFIHTATMKPY